MAKDTLSDIAGLPDELGIDEDFARSQQRLTVRVESRRYGKPVTLVSGFDPDLTDGDDLKELASELKREVGAGGTVRDGTIEVQGDHADRMPGLLRDRGFDVDLGGTLYGDVERQRDDTLSHSQKRSGTTHPVRLSPSSRLRELLGRDTLTVNTRHLQSVASLGAGFSVAARAPDAHCEVVQRLVALPDLSRNTREIVDKCDLELPMGELLMPHYPIPAAFEEDRTYPLLLEIHGGPMAMWGPGEATMWHEFQFFAGRGYGVVFSNPRGSGGYGLEFKRANYQDWGTGPAADVPEGKTVNETSPDDTAIQLSYADQVIVVPGYGLAVAQAQHAVRELADIARRYVGDAIRTTVEQNIVLRWVAEADLPRLYADLEAIGLADPGAGTIVDITACPGTDTCKLGIASSRGLAGELRTRLVAKSASMPQAIKDLKIKISGCFNSCGQHHVSDIGFYGNSRKVGSYKVPHFQVVLGGQWDENAGSYGLAIGAVPSKAVPDVLDAVTDRYVRERQNGESFRAWSERLGKREAREMLRPYMETPDIAVDRSYYSDWGDPRIFTLDDLGVGECAGEVVSLFSIEIAKAESEAFEAQVALEEKNYERADELSYGAMLLAARALVRTHYLDVSEDAEDVVREFRDRFYDTKLFHDRYARGKFAQYLFKRHEAGDRQTDADAAHRLVEEAQLFIEATHACEMRLNEKAKEAAAAKAEKEAEKKAKQRPTLPPTAKRSAVKPKPPPARKKDD